MRPSANRLAVSCLAAVLAGCVGRSHHEDFPTSARDAATACEATTLSIAPVPDGASSDQPIVFSAPDGRVRVALYDSTADVFAVITCRTAEGPCTRATIASGAYELFNPHFIGEAGGRLLIVAERPGKDTV